MTAQMNHFLILMQTNAVLCKHSEPLCAEGLFLPLTFSPVPLLEQWEISGFLLFAKPYNQLFEHCKHIA